MSLESTCIDTLKPPSGEAFSLHPAGGSAVIVYQARANGFADPVLTDLTVTLDGVALVEGVDYTYDEATGVFTTVPGRITVPAAAYAQDPATGEYTGTPGLATLIVTGTI